MAQQNTFRGEDEDKDEIYNAIFEGEPLYPTHMPKNASSLIKTLLVREPELRLGSGPTDALELCSTRSPR